MGRDGPPAPAGCAQPAGGKISRGLATFQQRGGKPFSWRLPGPTTARFPLIQMGIASKTEGSDSWTYTWNANNQLTKVEKNGSEVARFAYDPLGRRVEKVAGGVTTSFTYEGER